MSLLEWLEQKKGEVEDKMLVPQKRAFLEWALPHLKGGDAVLVTLDGREEWYEREAQRAKLKRQNYNSKFQTSKSRQGSVGHLRLVMCQPGEFASLLRNLQKENQQKEWQRIFDSRILEIWEERSYYEKKQEPLPLRFGFSDEENKEMMRVVRAMAEATLEGRKPEEPVFPERYQENVFLGAAAWIDGVLRSSVIIKDVPLAQALIQAGKELPFDVRFKPITRDELRPARIEITIIQEPKIPISSQEMIGRIDPARGYRVSWGEKKRGWYFPEVFNVMRFADMPDFFTHLSEDKAGISRRYLPLVAKETFEVTDFIESAGRQGIVPLHGPLPKPRAAYRDFDAAFQAELATCLREAADYLVRIQEEDGNIPPVFNPLTGKKKQIDWNRQALAAGALILSSRQLIQPAYKEAGQKALEYMRKNFFTHPLLTEVSKIGPSVYFAKCLILLGEDQEAGRIASRIREKLPGLAYDPIRHLQIASLFASLGAHHPEWKKDAHKLFGRILEDFDERRRRKQRFQLAYFPEALRVAALLVEKDRISDVTTWHAKQQLPDGSFPIFPGSRFAYTRGTGKIFEVLALEPEEQKKTLLRVFSWLRNMQYSQENSYFIAPHYQEKVLGGFRHDALNPDLWTDAAAHVLIGGSRILNFLKTGKKSWDF